jgi:hypothetical protein
MKEKGHQAPKDLVLKKETSDPKDRQSSRRRGVISISLYEDTLIPPTLRQQPPQISGKSWR